MPQNHALKEAAEDVRLTLYPEYITEVVQPFRKKMPVWNDEAPVPEPLCAMAFVFSGDVAQFQIPEPACSFLVFLGRGLPNSRQRTAE